MNISRGKINRPLRVVLYAPEGIGKTTFSAQFPEALFIDTEGGTAHMDVARFDRPETWEQLLEEVRHVYENPSCCKTLIVDTADWAEKLMVEYLCRVNRWKSVESPGYGKGYQYCAEEFARLLVELDQVIAAGIHVVVTAHAKMRKFEQPDEMGAYDRYEMKLTKQVAPLLKEWCDLLLFANYKTFVVQGSNAMEKAKVQGGKRVMYASHHPCWDAKNRQGLPDEMDFDFRNIAHIFKADAAAKKGLPGNPDASKEGAEVPESKPEPAEAPAAPPAKPIDTLRKMMAEANVTETEIRQVVASKGHYAADVPVSDYTDKFLNGWVIRYWPQVLKLIETGRTGRTE